ncbi:MAG: Acyl-CoA carboxylase epsilon subunit [Actinomycetota bacterium]|jgi:hypothetical protein
MISSADSTSSGFGVVRGNPSADELAIVVAVLQAASQKAAQESSQSEGSRSTWSRNATQLRSAVTPGQGQWQAAFRRGLAR